MQYGCSWFDILVLNIVCGSDHSTMTTDVIEVDCFFNRTIVSTLYCSGELRGATFTSPADRAQLRTLFQQIPKDLESVVSGIPP